MIAAVSVVFPWSTWPIVPTLTCGFVRWNCSFAMMLCRLCAERAVVVCLRNAPPGQAQRADPKGGVVEPPPGLEPGTPVLTMEVLYR